MYKFVLALRYLRKRLIALFAVASVTLCVFMVLVVMSVMGGFLEMVKERSRGLLSDIVIDNGSIQGFPFYQEFGDFLKEKMPDEIVRSTPVIYNYGILRVTERNYTKPVRVLGVRLAEYEQVNDFANSLHYDRYYPGTTSFQPQLQPVSGYDDRGQVRLPGPFEDAHAKWRETATPQELAEYDAEPFAGRPGKRYFGQSFGQPGYWAGNTSEEETGELPGLVIGCDVINERTKQGGYTRYYPLGQEMLLNILPVTTQGVISGKGAITLAMRYVDDSRTGVYEVDSVNVYTDFELIQRILRMDPREREDGTLTPPRTSQILVRLADGVDINQARAKITELWQSFRAALPVAYTVDEARLLDFVTVETWEERQRPFIEAVEKEKVLVAILYGVVSLVAIVLIGCIFYMVVEKKTRDIGILKSLGASSSGVASIFLAYGAAVGVVGSILGAIAGVLFVKYINEFQALLVRINPDWEVWSPDVYTFDRIPSSVDPYETGGIIGVAILASMLGALIPAILAARVWPVDALRYE